MKKDFFIIIPNGEHKGKRLYFEDKCGGEHILPIELYCLLRYSMNSNYNVFYLIYEAYHNIYIPENDLIYIKTTHKQPAFETYLKHNFSNDTQKIKSLQYNDILLIYNQAISLNQIAGFFIYPIFDKNNKYCFNIFLITNSNFNINNIFDLNFKLGKIISVIKHNKETLTIELMQKLYDLTNVKFKDYIIDPEEHKKTRPYDLMKLPEKIEYDNFMDQLLELKWNNFNGDFTELDCKKHLLQEKLYNKEAELTDTVLLKKLFFEKLCWQFYTFDEKITKDTVFYTNFMQLVNASVVVPSSNGPEINYNCLMFYSLDDLFHNDEYFLFGLYYHVWQWRKK